MIRTASALALASLLGACALKSDVKRVENEIVLLKAETARMDSARAAQLREVIAFQQRIMDTVAAGQQTLRAVRGDFANDLYNIQRQLVQVQELTGQSQQRLSEMRTQLETRSEQLAQAGPPADSGAPAPPPGASTGPSADQIYEASVAQLRKGSLATARQGFRELLRLYPTSARVPDALYFIGESFAAQTPDSAAAYYAQVVKGYAASTRAPTALYKLGLLAEQRRDVVTAKATYRKVIQGYPNSDEAALARERLKTLGR